jgi:lambda family phage portal protein
MSKLSARIYDKVFGSRQVPATTKHVRRYAAAKHDRLNSTWSLFPESQNFIASQDVRPLRARARDMSHNAPHFRKFLDMVRSNVVGAQGLRLQVKAYAGDGKTLDVELNKRIETAFWMWGHQETCTLSGKMDWIAAQRLFVTQLARDGEVLVRKIKAKNPFGFALKFIDVSYLDELFTVNLTNGNRVIMSVEIDGNDRPVAYWLTTPPTEIIFQPDRNPIRVRVPAEEIIHAFLISDDESQTRGVSWFHASLLDGRNLHKYKEGVITSARAAAMSMGFLIPTVPDEGSLPDLEDVEGEQKQVEIDWKPAGMTEMPAGYDFKQFDPKQPTQNHEAFYQSMVRDVAAGLGVNYFSLQGDMSSVNFSSARVGYDEERAMWRGLHQFVAAVFCRPVYHAWLRSAWASSAIDVTPEQFQQVRNPTFRGRGWPYLEPVKDITASVMALQNNLMTLTDALNERGIDPIDHFETIQSERELAKRYGIDLVYVSKVTATDSTAPNAGEGDSTDKPGTQTSRNAS